MKYWLKAKVMHSDEDLLVIPMEGAYQELTLVITNKKYSFQKEDIIEILCDDVVTLSLPPRRIAYDIKLVQKGRSKMRFNLIEFKERFINQFPQGSAQELEAIEQELKYDSFNTEDAYILGSKLYEKAKSKGDLAICIIRESDQLPIFQLIMDSKKQRNLDFGEAKRQTVLKTGHCSLWAIAKEMTDGGLDDLFVEDSPCLPVGGAFPIYVGDRLEATLFVSGLHEGLDHILILEALSEILEKDIPNYHGPIL